MFRKYKKISGECHDIIFLFSSLLLIVNKMGKKRWDKNYFYKRAEGSHSPKRMTADVNAVKKIFIIWTC